jgi:hypothetical protein
MSLLDLAREVEPVLASAGKLVRLEPNARIVFAGDVHGDAEAVDRVLGRFSAAGTAVVFLGDLVDRGPSSREALTLALRARLEHPDSVVLLMGNHEAWGAARFSPADFWESLSHEEVSTLARVLLRLPLAAWHPAGVLALHGALPDIPALSDLMTLAIPSPSWRDVTWGDWSESRTELPLVTGRPTYGAREFDTRAGRLGASVLIRSHQPDAPTYLFGDRCLTLFTSSAYGEGPRRVAVLPPGRAVRTARDLDLIEV